MIITHASAERIENTKTHYKDALWLKGCLCFASEGNTYNMAGNCNYQYNIDVSSIIPVKSFFIRHNYEEQAVQDVFQMLREDLELDVSDETIANLLDESENVRDYNHGYWDDGMADWAIQQYQGILAHKLGYDCAQSHDEQGTVYIAYCVGREMQEIECN